MMQFSCKAQVNAPIFSLPVVLTPSFAPGAGTYTSAQSVTITCLTPSSNIFYTTDGSTPTTSSTHYTAPVSVATSQTIQAIATAAGFIQSPVGSASYVLNVANPVFSPVAGTYTPPQSVTITSATPGASIFYTTDGSTPTPASTLYTGAIAVSTTQTIKAIATFAGFNQSSVVSAAYSMTLTALWPDPLPDATINVPYSFTLTATGGIPPYSYSLVSGTLPTGLSLVVDTITGTPTVTISLDAVSFSVTDSSP